MSDTVTGAPSVRPVRHEARPALLAMVLRSLCQSRGSELCTGYSKNKLSREALCRIVFLNLLKERHNY